MLNIRELSFCQILVFSFLAQVPDEFREARRDVLHKLGSSFCSVSPLLSLPSPDGEHGVYYSLERVEIARRHDQPSPDHVLLKLDIQSQCILSMDQCAHHVSDRGVCVLILSSSP